MKRFIHICRQSWGKLSNIKLSNVLISYGWRLLLAIGVFLLITVTQNLSPNLQSLANSLSNAIAVQPVLVSQSANQLLIEQGNRLYGEGKLQEAIATWQAALKLYQGNPSANAQINAAICLNYLAMAYQDLGEMVQTQQAIAQAEELIKLNAANQSAQMVAAQINNTKGSWQFAMGQTQLALESWQTAASQYAALDDSIGKLGSQVNQLQALQSLGFYRQSYDLASEIEIALQAEPNTLLKAIALRSLGKTFQHLGNLPRSQDLLNQSLKIAEQLANAHEVSASLLSIGHNFRFAQDYDSAIANYEKAAQVAPSDVARLEAKSAQISLLKRNEANLEAKTIWQQISPQVMGLKPSRRSIYLQVNIADSLISINENLASSNQSDLQIPVADIANLLTDAVRQAQSLQDRRSESFAIGELGRLYAHNQQLNEAAKLTQRAIALASETNADDLIYRWQIIAARILNQQAKYDQAIATYQQAINNIQILRKELNSTSPEVQFAFRERIEPAYREYISLLLQQDSTNPDRLKQVRKTLESMQVAELENFFQSTCINVKPQQIDAIDPNSAVIYSIALDDRLGIIVSMPNTPLKYYETKVASSEVSRMVDQFLQSLNPAFADQDRLKYSQIIYDWLIRPEENDLSKQNINNLVFVLDGSLRNLPLAPLYDGKQYLIEKYSLAFTPGLQLLGAQPLDRSQLRVWLGALSQSRQGFRQLDGVKSEAEQISRQIPTNLELDLNFTKSTLQNGITKSNAPIVHLATHGQFGSSSDSTFVVVWDGRITVPDFYSFLRDRTDNLTNPLELLVLSACQTAEGDDRATLGLAGLALRSGARSTIGSLWAVNDSSTSLLMSRFYEILRQPNISRTKALQKSQISILQSPEYKHPYYWAAFVLVGSWL